MKKDDELKEALFLLRYNGLHDMADKLVKAEATEKAYQKLQRDVKRFRDLDMAHSYLTTEQHLEYLKLDVKLSKVGSE
jgi:hypothetical protein